MEDFNTLEKVQLLFNSAMPGEEWSAFFVGYKDVNATTPSYALMGGAVGGFIGGAMNAQEYPYDAMLVALGKNGIAYFPLQKPSLFKYKLKDLTLEKDKGEYIPYNIIDKISAKKFPLGKNKKLRIRVANGKDHHLIINAKEDLPYHDAGVTELMNRFGKKK
ncbi:hypothetical protein IJI29_03075 [Candidatus Saccharibacteria bacterium]|nr:hypothetical protein [Candidatus Saccharibacteria bacterium]